MKYRDNEPKVDAGLAASLKALRDKPMGFHTGGYTNEAPSHEFADLPGGVVNVCNVIQLDAHRPDPHIVLIAPGKAHVIPEAYIADIVAGTVDISTIDPSLIRDVFRDWLTQAQADKDDRK